MDNPLIAYYGLPEKVVFCRSCVMSNQRPASFPEFKHTAARITPTLHIDDEGICDACRYNEQKPNIDWEAREAELLILLDHYRSDDGSYDCIVPGSGGKDSAYAAHLLKYKYGMHPLTITWPPTIYTDYGYANFKDWIDVGGFDNVTFKPSGRVHKLLTRLGLENLLHPFQTFILGQKHLAPKIAAQYGVPLVFYGESEAEYGNPIAETKSSLRDKSYFTMKDMGEIYIGGVSIPELKERYGLSLNDLSPYLPPEYKLVEKANIDVRYLGYYVRWTPQEAYYYAVEHTGFQARPFRTAGTYSKYSGIDDKIDDLHFYTTFIKFGIGRATYDASQEIRNNHLTREEGVALVHRFDGEFPERYFQDVMDYLEMDPNRFYELRDQARSPHLWMQASGKWVLRHQVV
jgi:N-acetyl sugar amidotransferase